MLYNTIYTYTYNNPTFEHFKITKSYQ